MPRLKAQINKTEEMIGRGHIDFSMTFAAPMLIPMDAGEPITALAVLDAFGSCRLCLVEIEGRGGTPASCTTPVAEGIVVRTKSERLDRLRKDVMELHVSDHPVDSLDRAKYAGFDLLAFLKKSPQFEVLIYDATEAGLLAFPQFVAIALEAWIYDNLT
jgi:hypothetical protein